MTAAELAGWWVFCVRTTALYGWRWLPGPWPVKIALCALIACGQLIPGELDELLLIALIAWVKRWIGRRRAAARVTETRTAPDPPTLPL